MAAQTHAAEANNPAPKRELKHLSLEEATHMDIGVFGQQAGMQIYTQISYIFGKTTADKATTVATLERGLARLVGAFPWLGGQIVLSPKDNRRHFAPLTDGPPSLVVKDVSEDTLTYEALRSSGYPISLLDESVVAPRRTLPSPDEPAEMPVLLVQATFLADGLVLTIVCHHAAMDMVGQTAVIAWLAKACRSEEYTEEELAVGNGDRIGAVDLLEDVKDPFTLIPEQVLPPTEPKTESTETKTETTLPPPPVKSVWSYFNFSKTALKAIKDEATSTLPKDGSGVSFVSTNDALSAFLWQSVLRGRRSRLPPSTLSTFARAIDVRRYMGVAPQYPGLLQNMTIHTHPASWVCDASLGEASSQLRAAILQPDRLRERTRALATCFVKFPEQANSRLSFVGHVDPTAGGLMLSSWTTAPGISTDFGIGGLPSAVRRPGFVPVESLAYLMPSDGDGTVAAGICLREADLAVLQQDPAFTKYAKYVG